MPPPLQFAVRQQSRIRSVVCDHIAGGKVTAAATVKVTPMCPPRLRPANYLARSFPHPNIRSPTYRRSKSPTRRPQQPNPKPRRPPNCCAQRARCLRSEIRNRINRPPSRRERAPSPNCRQLHSEHPKLRPPNRPRHRPQHRPQTNLAKLRWYPQSVRRCRQRLRPDNAPLRPRALNAEAILYQPRNRSHLMRPTTTAFCKPMSAILPEFCTAPNKPTSLSSGRLIYKSRTTCRRRPSRR